MCEYPLIRCLFCNTGKEDYVLKTIHDKHWGKALFPQRKKIIMKNMYGGERVRHEVFAPLIPGYVFFYTDDPLVRGDLLGGIHNVIRVLRYADGSDLLAGADLAFAQQLLALNGRLDVMQAVQIGDHIEIIDGVFKALKGKILQMDKRRQTFKVELNTSGAINHIWLAYEIVKKLEATP